MKDLRFNYFGMVLNSVAVVNSSVKNLFIDLNKVLFTTSLRVASDSTASTGCFILELISAFEETFVLFYCNLVLNFLSMIPSEFISVRIPLAD